MQTSINIAQLYVSSQDFQWKWKTKCIVHFIFYEQDVSSHLVLISKVYQTKLLQAQQECVMYISLLTDVQ